MVINEARAVLSPLVTVIVVNYNSASLLKRCIGPVLELGKEVAGVSVIDNSGSDYLEETITGFDTENRVALTPFIENYGFGRANNIVAERTESKYILFLNPDAFLADSGQLRQLVSILEADAELGFVGPMLINVDGSHQIGDAGFATTLMSAAGHAFLLHRFLRKWPSFYIANRKSLASDGCYVDWICGACLLVRRAAWDDVGGFNDEIFMYGEDVDWGVRASRKGWKGRYVPSIKVLHLQGGTQVVEGVAFRSTKWLDTRIKLLLTSRGRVYVRMFILILLTGFGFQASVSGVLSPLLSPSVARKQSDKAFFFRYLLKKLRES